MPVLGLLVPTDPIWAEKAEADLPGLLTDHAHCEIKAAQSALGMIARFAGEYPALVEPLIALAHEETDHFALVSAELHKRNHEVAMPRSDEYVAALRKACRSDYQDYPTLLDRLLVCALVEARSCERFHVLSEHLRDVSLQAFYKDLMASEARHYRLFVRLAEERFGISDTRARLQTLCEREAKLVVSLPLGPTVHG